MNVPVKEMLKEWRYTENEIGATGTRAFIDVAESDPAAIELPIIGAGFPSVISGAIVKTIDEILYHVDRTTTPANKKKYTVNYSSNTNLTQTYPTDERLWRIEAGSESIIVPPKPDTYLWVWANGYGADPAETSTDVEEQGFAYRALVGTLTQTKVFASHAAYITWLTTKFMLMAGRLDSRDFHIPGATTDMFQQGSLMLLSHSGGNKFDSAGGETVPIEIVFGFKRIPVLDHTDFQYLLDVDPAAPDTMWRIPAKNGVTGPDRLMFKSVDMDSLQQ